ncbi:MAG: TOBE domain-containing protein [Acidobacteria bacterium]|nr:TOBE domain-containing protein [Acidobacteriota bacterium]
MDPGGVGSEVYLLVRGEDVLLTRETGGVSSARNRLAARVLELASEGPLVRVTLDAGFPLSALVTRPAAAELGLAHGLAVTALLKAPAIHVVPRTRS